jgi:hypothetical protein
VFHGEEVGFLDNSEGSRGEIDVKRLEERDVREVFGWTETVAAASL